MPDALFGEWLGRIVPLTAHDVCEIVEEQAGTGRRFGEVALACGFCQPEHVWQAWAMQLSKRTPHVDLRAVGVDAQAAAYLPQDLAAGLRVVPVRAVDGALIVATTRADLPFAAEVLSDRLRMAPRFVTAEREQVAEALVRMYGEAARPQPEPAGQRIDRWDKHAPQMAASAATHKHACAGDKSCRNPRCRGRGECGHMRLVGTEDATRGIATTPATALAG